MRLSISQFQNSKQDKPMTESVTEEHELGQGSGRWVKSKFPKEALAPIRTFINQCREWHYKTTLPWEEGVRLLSSNALEHYQLKSAQNRDELKRKVDEFILNYPSYMEGARLLHNGTFDESDYPTAGDMALLFRYKFEIEPVPTTGGLAALVGRITEQRMTELRSQLNEANNRRMDEAVHDVWRRVMEPVMSLATQLTSNKAAFKAPMLNNVKEIVGLMPTLNITGDPRLMAISRQIDEMLSGIDVESLKSSQVLVNQTATKALGILKTIGDYGSRNFAD